MKKLARVFREAARMVAQEELTTHPDWLWRFSENWSCVAVAKAEGAGLGFTRSPSVAAYIAAMGFNDSVALGEEFLAGGTLPNERDDMRVLALLFAAEMVQTGDVE